MPSIDLYQLPASGPCRAVLMTAQHIGVDVNKKNVDLLAGEQMKPEFLQVSRFVYGSGDFWKLEIEILETANAELFFISLFVLCTGPD